MTQSLRHKLMVRLTGAMIACLMVLAMTLTAWAHRVPAGDDLAMRNFIMAGGSYNDLCGDGMRIPGDCPLCRLSDAVALPEPPSGLPDILWRFVLTLESAAPRPVPAGLAWAVPEARGPPSL